MSFLDSEIERLTDLLELDRSDITSILCGLFHLHVARKNIPKRMFSVNFCNMGWIEEYLDCITETHSRPGIDKIKLVFANINILLDFTIVGHRYAIGKFEDYVWEVFSDCKKLNLAIKDIPSAGERNILIPHKKLYSLKYVSVKTNVINDEVRKLDFRILDYWGDATIDIGRPIVLTRPVPRPEVSNMLARGIITYKRPFIILHHNTHTIEVTGELAGDFPLIHYEYSVDLLDKIISTIIGRSRHTKRAI